MTFLGNSCCYLERADGENGYNNFRAPKDIVRHDSV
ncbi:hypothetical protein BofuT4_uP068900.1 [Botrytis cinerea T4]|uniref:Uncharacterized protein n=1 Tax=Botryotinia fuckeliana (strain T4) TaxID=999810 RepID=G2XQE5_BOTF4|nr:hypothetical protein BofuT4_uP068900.1 [Botrytis cinerea T4]